MLGIVYCLWGIGCSSVGKKGSAISHALYQAIHHHHHPYLRSFKHLIHTPRTSRLCENRVLVTLEITARPGYQRVKKGVGVGGGGCVECAREAAFGCPIAIIRKTLSVKVGRDGKQETPRVNILVNMTSQRPITRRIIIQHSTQHAHQRIFCITNLCQLILAIFQIILTAC